LSCRAANGPIKTARRTDAEIFVFDDTIVQRRFESLALDAVHVLRQATTR
jgi:hypothetical protein